MGKSVLLFSASWCSGCRVVKPYVKQLQDEGVDIKIIDAESEAALAAELNVNALPTFIVYQDDKELDRISGAIPRTKLENFIAEA